MSSVLQIIKARSDDRHIFVLFKSAARPKGLFHMKFLFQLNFPSTQFNFNSVTLSNEISFSWRLMLAHLSLIIMVEFVVKLGITVITQLTVVCDTTKQISILANSSFGNSRAELCLTSGSSNLQRKTLMFTSRTLSELLLCSRTRVCSRNVCSGRQRVIRLVGKATMFQIGSFDTKT